MNMSFKIGNIFGIKLRIHVTFFFLLFFIFFATLYQRGTQQALYAVVFICLIFICVIIHELGHTIIAQRFGKIANDIILLPIGGISNVDMQPDKPIQEILISAVGPIINLLIAGIIYLFIDKSQTIGINATLYPSTINQFLSGLVGMNILLAVFNLIPAFPMDGGRVLRGILALGMNYSKATTITVFIGQTISLFFIFYGIFFNWWLALIGIFIYIGAGAEKQQFIFRSILHQVKAGDVMITDFHILKPDEPLSKSLEYIYHGFQNDFLVMGDKGIEGVLTRNDIISSIHKKGVDIHVSDVMDRSFTSVDIQTPLDNVYTKLLLNNKNVVVVYENNDIKGMLSFDSISRYILIQAAMKGIE